MRRTSAGPGPGASSLLRLELEPPPSKLVTNAASLGLRSSGGRSSSMILEQGGHTAYVHTPSDVGASPVPLLVVMHGAGKGKYWSMNQAVDEWEERARAYNMVVLFPEARGSTWDYISSKRTARKDFDFIQDAMNSVRRAFPIDDRRIGIIGLSDGASMALSLSVHNPSIFQAGMSVSAGFCASPPVVSGRTSSNSPKLFMTHGSEDSMFQLERVGIPLKDKMKKAGHDVYFKVAQGHGHCPRGWQDTFLPSWLAMKA